MSVHVLLNLLNDLRKRDKVRGLPIDQTSKGAPVAIISTLIGCCFAWVFTCEKIDISNLPSDHAGALWLLANAIRYFCKVWGGWPRAFTNLWRGK